MNPYLLRILRFAFLCGKQEIKKLVVQYLTSLPSGSVKDMELKYIVKPLTAKSPDNQKVAGLNASER